MSEFVRFTHYDPVFQRLSDQDDPDVQVFGFTRQIGKHVRGLMVKRNALEDEGDDRFVVKFRVPFDGTDEFLRILDEETVRCLSADGVVCSSGGIGVVGCLERQKSSIVYGDHAKPQGRSR